MDKIVQCTCQNASASGGQSPPDLLYRGFAPGLHWETYTQDPLLSTLKQKFVKSSTVKIRGQSSKSQDNKCRYGCNCQIEKRKWTVENSQHTVAEKETWIGNCILISVANVVSLSSNEGFAKYRSKKNLWAPQWWSQNTASRWCFRYRYIYIYIFWTSCSWVQRAALCADWERESDGVCACVLRDIVWYVGVLTGKFSHASCR